jgi:hypothetical protein
VQPKISLIWFGEALTSIGTGQLEAMVSWIEGDCETVEKIPAQTQSVDSERQSAQQGANEKCSTSRGLIPTHLLDR